MAAIVLIVAVNLLRHLMQPIRGVLRAMVSAGLVVLLMVLALGLIVSSLVLTH